ncbi:MAG: ComF family protein [Clostridiales bacterium]|nr:ComF family protein [Clostridiales bacterium]
MSKFQQMNGNRKTQDDRRFTGLWHKDYETDKRNVRIQYKYIEGTETVKEILLSLLFPRRCPVCQEIVEPVGEKICPSCRKKISFICEPCCQKCGKPILKEEDEWCYDCQQHVRTFDCGVSLMNYDKIGRRTMKAFKYQGRQEYADFYMEELFSRHGKELRGFRPDCIIPVPIHKSRRRKRGYNQAELLAKRLGKRLQIPVECDLLVRYRKTTAQKELNAQERQRNLEKALRVRFLPKGMERVILVDDIYTTGSTAEACTRVLKKAGVGRVMVVTVCIGNNF